MTFHRGAGFLTCLEVPQSNCVVLTPGKGAVAIRGKGDSPNYVAVAKGRAPKFVAVFHFPEAHHLVEPAGDRAFTVRRISNAGGMTSMQPTDAAQPSNNWFGFLD